MTETEQRNPLLLAIETLLDADADKPVEATDADVLSFVVDCLSDEPSVTDRDLAFFESTYGQKVLRRLLVANRLLLNGRRVDEGLCSLEEQHRFERELARRSGP